MHTHMYTVPTKGKRRQNCFDRDATAADVCGKKNTEGTHIYTVCTYVSTYIQPHYQCVIHKCSLSKQWSSDIRVRTYKLNLSGHQNMYTYACDLPEFLKVKSAILGKE